MLNLFAGLAFILVLSSYAESQYTRLGDSKPEQDSLLPAMTLQDVIDLSKAKVSDDVIIDQMRSTQSYFQLSTNDIIALKNEGVSEKVITAMIKSSPPAQSSSRSSGYYYGGYYYPYPYWWYPGLYFAFRYPYIWPHHSHYYVPYHGFRYPTRVFAHGGFATRGFGHQGFGMRGFGGFGHRGFGSHR